MSTQNVFILEMSNDVAWTLFRRALEYFAGKFNIFNTQVVGVNPKMTSQKCSDCGAIVRQRGLGGFPHERLPNPKGQKISFNPYPQMQLRVRDAKRCERSDKYSKPCKS